MVVGYTAQTAGSVVDWEQRWSNEARRKQLPSLHGIVSTFQAIPGVIGMHGGLPPSDSFPFTSLGGGLADVGVADMSDLDIHDPKTVAAAQQYNMQPKGHAPLVTWARDMVISLHKPATLNPTHPPPASPVGMEIVITQGSSAALDSLCRMLLNPGDPILLEEYTYAHVVEADLLPLGCELLPIQLDQGGLIPSHLDDIMISRQAAGLPLPRVLYTIPTGQNPTGSVMSPDRMAEVYRLAQKWDLVIIEDDAYYWLQYPNGPENVPGLNLRPGFLSVDTDGRVIRLDTLAKLLGPGFRLGWLAAPPQLAAKFGLYTSGISIGANMLSQVMVYEMLIKWGRAGFEGYVKKLQRRYASNAAVAAAAAAEHLGGLAVWQPARAGMFMWLKMTGANADSSQLIDAAADAQVMVVPGHLISVTHLQAAAHKKFSSLNSSHSSSCCQQQQQQRLGCSSCSTSRSRSQQQQQQFDVIEPSPFFRVSFVSVGPETLKEGFARLAIALRNCSSSTNSSTIASETGCRTASESESAAEIYPPAAAAKKLAAATAAAAAALTSGPTPELLDTITAAVDHLKLTQQQQQLEGLQIVTASNKDIVQQHKLQKVDSGSALQPPTPPADAAADTAAQVVLA